MDYFSINAMGVSSDIDRAANCLEKLKIVTVSIDTFLSFSASLIYGLQSQLKNINQEHIIVHFDSL
jgi:hypothetical protein